MAKARTLNLSAGDLVILELSKDEAQAVQDVCGKIGGDPFSTRRRHFNDIRKALYAVYIYASDIFDAKGNIYFE